jgi:hypothetical protein
MCPVYTILFGVGVRARGQYDWQELCALLVGEPACSDDSCRRPEEFVRCRRLAFRPDRLGRRRYRVVERLHEWQCVRDGRRVGYGI